MIYFSVHWIELLCWVFIGYVLCAVSFLSGVPSLASTLWNKLESREGVDADILMLLNSQWAGSLCSLVFVSLSDSVVKLGCE